MTSLDRTKNSIGIILVNWACREKILTCLEVIRKHGYLKCVVVVDNGSNDGSIEILKIKYKKFKIKIIENKRNLGFAEGNNVGIRYLLKEGIKYVFILNPDTIILKDTISILVNYMEKNREVGIAGPKIHSVSSTVGGVPFDFAQGKHATPEVSSRIIWSCGGVIDKYRYSGGLIGIGEEDKGQYDQISDVDYTPGAAMMVRREVFEKVGLFHSLYFIYYEDVELCVRARKAGFKIQLVPKSIIYHNESSSMIKNSPAQSYYLARNHLLFVERNASLSIKIRELIRIPKTIYEHIKKKESYALLGIRDYFLRRFGKSDYWS